MIIILKNDLENESCNGVIQKFFTIMDDTVVRFQSKPILRKL